MYFTDQIELEYLPIKGQLTGRHNNESGTDETDLNRAFSRDTYRLFWPLHYFIALFMAPERVVICPFDRKNLTPLFDLHVRLTRNIRELSI